MFTDVSFVHFDHFTVAVLTSVNKHLMIQAMIKVIAIIIDGDKPGRGLKLMVAPEDQNDE